MNLLLISFLISLAGCATPSSEKIGTAPAPRLVTRQLQSRALEAVPLPLIRVPQSVSLAWTPPADPSNQVTDYYIYVGTQPDLWQALVIDAGNITNASVGGLSGGIPYYFAVTDSAADGAQSDYSGVVTFTPPIVLDLRFAFDVPVTNVVLQASRDLIQWQDVLASPTNAVWQVTVDPSSRMMIFRSMATTIP